MTDDFLQKPKKRKIQDLNIVPILDMLTTVIFFLLLSTSFLEYVKLTVPPSSVSTVSASSTPPAASPSLFLVSAQNGLRLLLRWSGEKAGSLTRTISAADPVQVRTELLAQSAELAQEFAKLNSAEKTLKLGLGAEVPFQHLISVMDGVRGTLPDVVLVSHHDAEAGAGGAP